MNMSVWESVEALAAFVVLRPHRPCCASRRQWFEQMGRPTRRCGGSRAAHVPTTGDAEDAVRRLRAHGPTPAAFTLREHFPPPGVAPDGPRTAPDDWMCPA